MFWMMFDWNSFLLIKNQSIFSSECSFVYIISTFWNDESKHILTERLKHFNLSDVCYGIVDSPLIYIDTEKQS